MKIMKKIDEMVEDIRKNILEVPFPSSIGKYSYHADRLKLTDIKSIQEFCDNVLPKVPLELQHSISYPVRMGEIVYGTIADLLYEEEGQKFTLDLRNLKVSLALAGFRIYRGTLEIHGNVGKLAGLRMRDKGKLIIHGHTGHSLGAHMENNAVIKVYGNAGHVVGIESKGGEIYLHGDYGSIGHPPSTFLPSGAEIYHKGKKIRP